MTLEIIHKKTSNIYDFSYFERKNYKKKYYKDWIVKWRMTKWFWARFSSTIQPKKRKSWKQKGQFVTIPSDFAWKERTYEILYVKIANSQYFVVVVFLSIDSFCCCYCYYFFSSVRRQKVNVVNSFHFTKCD